eukprot:1599823-Alexandrium_andersonii.AAC.1
MAVRLAQWSRNHFKVAQSGRAATRAAIIRLMEAAAAAMPELSGDTQGPSGSVEPTLNPDDS